MEMLFVIYVVGVLAFVVYQTMGLWMSAYLHRKVSARYGELLFVALIWPVMMVRDIIRGGRDDG